MCFILVGMRKAMNPHDKLTLITGPDISEQGGVSNFLRTLLRHREQFTHPILFVPVGMKARLRRFGWLFRLLIWPIRVLTYSITVASRRPDVIHLNPSLDPKSLIRDAINARIGEAFGSRILVFFRGWDLATEHVLGNRFSMTGFCGRSLTRRASSIIVLAERMEQLLIQTGVKPSKIVRLPMMVDTKEFQQVECDPLPENKPERGSRILFLSRLEKEKGATLLLQAAAILHDKNRFFQLTIAGDGSLRNDLVQAVEELDLERFVLLPGNVEGREKICLYRSADVFAFPTNYGEGFPNVIAEAMAAGLPIVTTRVGGIPDYLEDGVHCLFLDENDPPELADTLIRLLDDDPLRQSMARQNRQMAEDVMDVSVVLTQLDQMYEDLSNTYEGTQSRTT